MAIQDVRGESKISLPFGCPESAYAHSSKDTAAFILIQRNFLTILFCTRPVDAIRPSSVSSLNPFYPRKLVAHRASLKLNLATCFQTNTKIFCLHPQLGSLGDFFLYWGTSTDPGESVCLFLLHSILHIRCFEVDVDNLVVQ